ncbi:hypothetical protein DSECCO2_113380 [anaerobic digester metagenome]
MVDISKVTGSHHFPQRKNKFKEMVGKICSSGASNKSSKESKGALLTSSIQTRESANWLSKNPKRWNNFQNQYQNEFDEKIKLMGEIRGKKKDNEVIQSLFSFEDSDF